MSSSATELQKYMTYWDKYKALWEMDKEFFIRKYAKSSKTPVQFDNDISRYRHQQGEIISEASNHTINFVRVDCTVLKDGLVGHCLQYQTRLTGLLNQNGAQELQDIYQLFEDSRANLTVSPANLDELSAKIALCKQLKDDRAVIQGRFDPMREVYDTLVKFEVVVNEGEAAQLASLDDQFDEFKQMLGTADRMLDKAKVVMKRELEGQVDAHGEAMDDLRTMAQGELPFGKPGAKMPSPAEAFALVQAYQAKVVKARERETELAYGLAIFGIERQEHEALAAVSKDLGLLEQIWTITQEWEEHWDRWQCLPFNALDTEEMENTAGKYTKAVGKLGREIKRWRVWGVMKKNLDDFREITPLIMDLRNKALRPRHWESLKDRVGQVCGLWLCCYYVILSLFFSLVVAIFAISTRCKGSHWEAFLLNNP